MCITISSHNIDKHYSSSTTMWCVNCEGIAHDTPVKEYLTNSFTHCNIYFTRDTLWCRSTVSCSGAFWVRGRYLFLYMTWVNSYPKRRLAAAKKYTLFSKIAWNSYPIYGPRGPRLCVKKVPFPVDFCSVMTTHIYWVPPPPPRVHSSLISWIMFILQHQWKCTISI